MEKEIRGHNDFYFTLVTTKIRLTLKKLSFPKNRDPYKKKKKLKKNHHVTVLPTLKYKSHHVKCEKSENDEHINLTEKCTLSSFFL